MKNKKEFNIVIVGTGGQGLITLLQILAEAALIEGYDVKTSELHGLSQRGGSVEVHIRFGPSACPEQSRRVELRASKKIFSPLVCQGGADLILGLEMQECLKACQYSDAKTTFLLNKLIIPILGQKPLSEQKILKELKKFSKTVILIPAADICEKELGKSVVAGVYLLSYAVHKKIIPLKPNSILKAIQKTVPKKHYELNKKTFELARHNFLPSKNLGG